MSVEEDLEVVREDLEIVRVLRKLNKAEVFFIDYLKRRVELLLEEVESLGETIVLLEELREAHDDASA